MTEQLSSFRIKKGRRVFDSYSAINSFSFALVTGNTLTLYALSLGANSTVVGLLSAFGFLSFFAIPLGKIGLKKTTLVKTFANNWMLRNWSLVPLLAIPYLSFLGRSALSLVVLLSCVFCYNFFRGIGLIANNPVIGILAPGKDRGEYIVRLSLINNGTALLATVLLALLLWKDAGIRTYNMVVLIGILAGIAASALLYRLPEPGVSENPEGSATGSFFPRFVEAFKEKNFRLFILSYLVIGLGIGMARPFVIVYCKAVYNQRDSIVTVFTICSSIGALFMGSIMRLVIDRLGAKPLYIIFTTISLFSLALAVAAPGIGLVLFSLIFLCFFSAVINMGFAGEENAAQTYFFGMVSKEALMDLSMLYYFILGGTGALGSIIGGTLLDLLTGSGLTFLASFRIFFLLCIVFIAIGIHIQRKLLDLGSYPVLDTIVILFSPRDMRALTLLRKLDSNEDPDEETGILAKLGEAASAMSVEGLIEHLSSPRFSVRYEALQSVSTLTKLNARMREALFFELENGVFSTASLAARLLGQFKVHQDVPLLHKALGSSDYRLAGEAMFALSRLRDLRGQYLISDIVLSSGNPFLLIRGVQAMEEYGTPASIPLLLDLLRNENLPSHVADETLLALSSLMGMQKKFYYAFADYTLDRKKAASILHDTLDEHFTRGKIHDPVLKQAVLDFIDDFNADTRFVSWILEFGKGRIGVHSALLVGVALDADLKRLEYFRFFLCFWASSIFVNPSLIEK